MKRLLSVVCGFHPLWLVDLNLIEFFFALIQSADDIILSIQYHVGKKIIS